MGSVNVWVNSVAQKVKSKWPQPSSNLVVGAGLNWGATKGQRSK